MNITEGLSKKEIARRKRLSAKLKRDYEKRRKEGLKRYWDNYRKEKAKRLREEEKEKKRIKKLKEKERNKKKTGRPKKSGPKINWYARRKKKQEAEKKLAARKAALAERKVFNYRIYTTRNGNKEKMVGKYKTIKEAYDAFNKEKLRSESVIFPRATRIDKKVENSIDECLLVMKTDEGPTMLRNEYGKLVENRTTLDGWEVVDKFRNNVEETFWVWGHDNRKDRKTFSWIYDSMLIRDGFDPYEFRRVFVFRNKVLVRLDDGSLEFAICKSDDDAVRLYNALQKKAAEDKVKQLIFIGDRSEKSDEMRKIVEELMQITGWSKKKVSMKNTTYYMTKELEE